MVYFDGFGGLVFIAVWIFCFVDVLVTPEAQCRNLPKLAWVFIVLLLPLLGSIGWLIAGHTWGRSAATPAKSLGRLGARVPATRPSARPNNPDDDEEFLASLRKRAEEQRQRARDQQDRPEQDRPNTEPA